jgi:amidase
MKLLDAARSIRLKPNNFTAAQQMAASLSNDDDRLGAERTRGSVMSHREWLSVNAMRQRLRMQWRAFFDEWDVVIYPAAAVPAFPHDHSEPLEARSLEVDGKPFPYLDACFIWADPASTCGLPATAAPIGQSPAGLPIGVQIIGPYLEDRTPIAFAGHLEREFGGFVPPF